jgi:protein tyrosine phosphatase (PTP) superfamily phosphohydrolase (DUF442 family)
MSGPPFLVLALVVALGCAARPLLTGAPEAGSGGVGGPGSTGGAAGASVSSACVAGQAILPDTLRNARDLGATPLPSDRSVACGALYRGGAIAGLSGDGCRAFETLGVRTVIDLRTTSERAGSPDAACLTATNVSAPMPTPFNVSPADYLVDLNTTDSIARGFAVLADEAAYPVFVHCTYGRDRTGVFTAVVLSTLGASREVIMEEYALSQATVGAFPNSLAAVLDRLQEVGGVEAFLGSAGVTPEQIAAVRARLAAR